MPLEGIDQFEVSNSLAVNVYGIGDDERVIPLRVSTIVNVRDTVDLLLIEHGERRHYCLIRDLEKLLQHSGSAESSFVQLSKNIADKHACINVQCRDGKSFNWRPSMVTIIWSFDIVSTTTAPTKLSLTVTAIRWRHGTSLNLRQINVSPLTFSPSRTQAQSNRYASVSSCQTIRVSQCTLICC